MQYVLYALCIYSIVFTLTNAGSLFIFLFLSFLLSFSLSLSSSLLPSARALLERRLHSVCSLDVFGFSAASTSLGLRTSCVHNLGITNYDI